MMAPPRIEGRPALDGFGVEWADERRLIVSRRNDLFELVDGAAPRLIARFPQQVWKEQVARQRHVQRALRFMYYNVLPLPSGEMFLTFGKDVGVIQPTSELQRIGGLHRPCRVLRGACALGADGAVYFGEYIDNAHRGPLHVYRYWPGASEVECVYSFSAGAIRHVHGVFTDPYGPDLWCAAGDSESECRIIRTGDGFRTHDIVGGGDETWRAVSLQFTPDAVFYAMDAEFRQNYIHRIDRKTGRRDVVQALEGPTYYSARRGMDLFFAVTAELAPIQKGKFAALWHVDGGTSGTQRLATFPKDAMSVRYFLPGTLDFAQGDGSRHEILFRTTALRPDNAVYAIL